MSDKNKVPQNQPLVTFVTPKQDILLYVVQDSRSGPFSQVKDYGSPYPNKAQYPEHELVFISPIDEEGNQKWYYARTRDKQEEYNFEISYPYGGRLDAPRYTRTYFLKREGYSPLTAGSADPVFSTAILVGQELKRIGQQELDSLYVLTQRIYDTIPAATEFDGASSSTSSVWGIKVDFPYNDEAYPRLTWRIPVKNSAYTATADLSACPVSGYTSLKLIDQEYQQDEKSANLGAWVRVYERLPSRVNYTPATHSDWGTVHLFSWRQAEYTDASFPEIGDTYTYGGNDYKILEVKTSPAKGSVIGVSIVGSPDSGSGISKASKEIDQVFCETQVVSQIVPIGTAFPDRGDFYNDGNASGYVFDVKLKNTDGVNANIDVKLTASNQASFTEYQLDNFTGDIFPVISTYSLGASQPSGQSVDSNGTYRETKRLGCNYWLSTTSKTTTFQSDSYEIIINQKWPSVLRSFRIDPIYRTGGTVVAKWMVDWDMKKEYIGPCRAVVTRVWTPGQPASEVPTLLIPESIVYEGIDLSFSIPACLHTTINVNETTGTNHPVYAYTVRSKTFNQTTYTDWPASIIAEVDVKPAFGGYLKEKMVVYAPE